MKKIYITKDQIENVTSFESMFKHFLGVNEITKKNISAPYRTDKSASLRVDTTKWLYSDFGDSDSKGNIYNLVAYIKGLSLPNDFSTVLNIINNEMNLGVVSEKAFKPPVVNWSDSALEYWSTYNVSIEVLKELNVTQFEAKNGGFGFRYNSKNLNKYKDYIPKQEKETKSFPYNSFNGKDIIGFEYLDKEENIIITAGEKDRIALYANTGIKGVNFLSESVKITPEHIEILKSKSTNIFICYDNDEPGEKNVAKIIELYPKDLIQLVLPHGIKDVADYFKAKNTKQSFIDIMQSSLEHFREDNDINLWADKKSYWVKKKQGKNWIDEKVSNFIIESPYLITSETDIARRLIKIITQTEETKYLAIDTVNFSSMQKFKSTVESKGNYFWRGSDLDLNNFKDMVLARSKVVRETETLGFDSVSESYLFSNKLLTSNGIIKQPNKFSVVDVDTSGVWIDKDYNKNNTLEYKANDSVTFQSWFKHLESAYGTEKAFFGAMHVALCVSFDIIGNEYGHFPLLFIYGRPGSGKTIFAKQLRKVFFPNNEKQTSFKGGTKISLSNFISQFSNAMIHFDEFKNDIKDLPEYIEKLKNIYDLIGRDKSTSQNNNKTYSDTVRSGVVITGEHIPQDEALGQRSILMTFDKKEQLNTVRQWEDLQSFSEKGLSNIITEVFSIRKFIKRDLKANRKGCSNEIKELLIARGKKLDGRVLNNFALHLTMYDFLAENNILKLDRNVILNSMIKIIESQIELFEEINPIDKFWQVFNDYLETEFLENHVFVTIQNESLVLSHSGIDKILEIARRNKRILPDKSTMVNYLKNDECFTPRIKDKNDKVTFQHGRKRGVFFDLVKIEEKYNFGLK